MVKLLIIAGAFLVVFVVSRHNLRKTESRYVNVEALLYGLVAALAVAIGMLLFISLDWLQDLAKRV